MSYIDNNEERETHSKSETMINDEKDEVEEVLFQWLLFRYQAGLETPWKVATSYLIVLIYHCTKNEEILNGRML